MRAYAPELLLDLLTRDITLRVASHLGAGDDSRGPPGWGAVGDEGVLWSTRAHVYGEV